ncbi:hypothetical protein IMX26_07415 [Clostridium sp. 'deep sea']|uniref:hypothetical protein n=1 Tax=Clostridium sp. 'deep sea' TaxID=2779445 RepID=UPI00189645C8|nr:hypothetical protein [Clostridium sp. 'deep sea']QOR36626.1 hypothetical protein IMX26_07415 [Clostridium sp. 'deep sea']
MNRILMGIIWSFLGLAIMIAIMLIKYSPKNGLSKKAIKKTFIKMIMIWLMISAFFLLAKKW